MPATATAPHSNVPGNLTAGKSYDALDVCNNGPLGMHTFWVVDDLGNRLFCLDRCCFNIRGQAWLLAAGSAS